MHYVSGLILTFNTHWCWTVKSYWWKASCVVRKIGISFPAFVTIITIVSWWAVNQV